ncbi:MAG: DUF952 domain-containing protein [Pseudomonadota bacterium]
MLIYKIFRQNEWAELKSKGETTGAPIDVLDGYVHFSTADQVSSTLRKHFAGETELVLLAVEVEPLGADLKWETARGDQLFPHLYRNLKLSDVLWNRDLDPRSALDQLLGLTS